MVLVHALRIPEAENLVHENRPFWRSSQEVVLDRSVLECDEIVVLVIRRDGDILVYVRVASIQSGEHDQILTMIAPGAASIMILFSVL